jgi:uncharacterized ferritin-like protein (DUF455 family)
MAGMPFDARPQALTLLQAREPAVKAAGARALWQSLLDGEARIDPAQQYPEPSTLPGRPERPSLTVRLAQRSRSAFTPEGRAALLHAIAHIEFNAINLALDAAWRFPGMPPDYYRDWLQVAAEEALHFTLLTEHLQTLGIAYGDHDAHDGLWQMCAATSSDFRARMALVPRTLEARGLDATPPLQKKLGQAGDQRAVEILTIILRDEIGHVAIGNRWYHWACERDGVDPETDFPDLCERYKAPRPRKPLNHEARSRAGFSAAELTLIENTAL